MKVIRYVVHFAALAVSAALFWLVRDFHLSLWISNINLFHYGAIGLLHATSLVISLRGQRTLTRALGFIALATALSAFTPFLGLFGSVIWFPLAGVLREKDLSADAILVTGSAIGAAGYWLLTQQFWLKSLRLASLVWTVAICVTSTLLVGLTLRMFGGYDRGVAKIEPDSISPILTAAWWLAFSTSLYLGEAREDAAKSKQGVVNASLVLSVLVFWLPLLLVIWSLAAVLWAPLDALTMALPQRVRNTVSAQLVAGSHFEAKDFPVAKRAVKLDPANEDAWTKLCSASVRDGTDLDRAMEACSRAAVMTDNLFHAQVIAEAYEQAHQPCLGLPVLKKTMGEESVSDISPIFSVGRLEATCGQMEDAERHLRAVVRLRVEDLRPFNWEDRPPTAGEKSDTYENSSRLSLSEARQNLSSLLTLRKKDEEALLVCRAALGAELARCTCHFTPRAGVACDFPGAR